MKRALLFLATGLALVAVYACSDDDAPAGPGGPNGVPVVVDGSTSGPSDANTDRNDGAPARRTSCLDRPGVPRPPIDGKLPCDLIPPGVTL